MESRGLWVFHQGDKAQLQTTKLTKLEKGKVRIFVEYSSINYKDALGVSGKGKIFRTFPMVPGIDCAGTVTESSSSDFKAGDRVLVTGCGLGETFLGGYQEYVDVDEGAVIVIPLNFTSLDAMLLGTAGFTAGLALHRMESLGQNPNMGPILISGASGGVGSIATKLCAKKGYDVIALSEKAEQRSYLESLGAKQVVNLASLDLGSKPLESIRFGAAIDNLGGEVLAALLKHVNLYGCVASIGLASSSEFSSSVMPFILRGVSLIGVSSANAPRKIREEVWSMLARNLQIEDLSSIHYKVIKLEEIAETVEDFFQRKVVGRVLVKIGETTRRP